jgi:hypothetical protein
MENEFERRPGMSFSGCRRLILNILTVLVLLTTLVLAVAFVAVFINPYMSINPYPPPTIPPTLGSPTPTYTPAKPLPSPWTSTPTFTLIPTIVDTPDATETPIPPTPTEEEDDDELPFALQVGSPARIENFINESGCDYMGVFGQVFNMENAPIIDLTVHLSGDLETVGPIDLFAITGSAPEVGPGGYVFNITGKPIASDGTLWIQLEDGGGEPLSDQVYLETSDSCSENLILVNWRQVR